MNTELLNVREIAFRVGVTSRTVRGWIARGELAQKGARPHALNRERKTVALYSLAAAQHLAQLHHERKARRKKRSA
jgi:hypothetical protein